MGSIDSIIVILYFALVIGLGFWYKKRASRDLGSYFLGGKSLHWLALAMSGSVSNFDITGTMWIISLIFVFGMKSMWCHWMWGFMMGAFFLSYMGKWVRRSGVLTAAEWMKTRFGDGTGGRLARTAYALMAVLIQASFIGYAFRGIGGFASVYIPLERLAVYEPLSFLSRGAYEENILAFTVVGITTLYVILGGLYSVVLTDVIQTVILTIGSIVIAVIAWSNLTEGLLEQLPAGWESLGVPWRIPGLAGTGYAMYELFGLCVMAWVMKGLLLNAGGPGQMYDFQRFLAARSPSDAAKVGAAWSCFLVVRWAMAVGVALLALTVFSGISDPEKAMPLVLQKFLPAGLRGIVIAGLLAAFMSTFSSTVNSGASFIVRDLWQQFVRPEATEKESVRFSYLATLLLVLIGVGIGLQAASIDQIWRWMMMELSAAVVIPNVLRWYWWRLNGWGYAWGTLGGIGAAIGAAIVTLFIPEVPDYAVFGIICFISLLCALAGSLLTSPVPWPALVAFYESVRPFGAWGPVRRASGITETELKKPSESPQRSIMNVIFGMVAISGLYLGPMYLVGHWYLRSLIWLGCALAAIIVLRFTWYRYLPEK